MSLQTMLNDKNISMYRLSQISGVPKTTVIDICSGKSSIENCNAKTVLQLSRALNCSMEDIMQAADSNNHYETALPKYLKDSLDNMKKAIKLKASGQKYLRYDCDYCEFQSDINTAEVSGEITPDQAWYLRSKYLGLVKEAI